jgi:chromate transporter
MTGTPDTAAIPPFPETVRTWGYIGLNSFGGPAGQIAVMHRVVVDEKKWISEERFLHALNFCMLLPGPEAMQLATYIGWLMHGVRGGLAAGLLFVLPGALVMLGLSMVYATWQELTLVQALFFGLKAAVLAIVVEAVQRIGKRALKDRFAYGVAAAAFIAIFLFQLPFPLIVLGAALIGWLRQHWANESGASPVNGADLGNGAPRTHRVGWAMGRPPVGPAHSCRSLHHRARDRHLL